MPLLVREREREREWARLRSCMLSMDSRASLEVRVPGRMMFSKENLGCRVDASVVTLLVNGWRCDVDASLASACAAGMAGEVRSPHQQAAESRPNESRRHRCEVGRWRTACVRYRILSRFLRRSFQ